MENGSVPVGTMRDPPYWGDLRGELTARGLRVRAVGLAGGICHSSGGGEQAAIGEEEWAIHWLVIEKLETKHHRSNRTESHQKDAIRRKVNRDETQTKLRNECTQEADRMYAEL